MRFLGFSFVRYKAGYISEESIYVCYHKGYMYSDHRLLKLLWMLLTEFKTDKHIIG